MNDCDFPNCPSGSSMKLFDERHEEVKSSLLKIERGQDNIISIMTALSGQAVDIVNIKNEISTNLKQHNEFFLRLRKIENKGAWVQGVVFACTGIIAIIEAFKLLGVLH